MNPHDTMNFESPTVTGSPTGSVIDLILKDHRLLRDDLALLKSPARAGAEMRKVLVRFLRILRAHTVAEEGALLGVLENFRAQRVRILEAFDEHDLHETLEEQVEILLRETPDWSDTLRAKSKVLAEAVEHHLDEEEKLLAVAGTLLNASELDLLRGPYSRLRRANLEKDANHG